MLRALAFLIAAMVALPQAIAGPAPSGDQAAARKLVAVVKTPDADGPCQEIVTRIIAELLADGTPVVALTCWSSDPRCLAPSGARLAAIVLVELRDNVRAVEVRAGDLLADPPAPEAVATSLEVGRPGGMQRVAVSDSGGGPAALAVRTVELLRAMLFDASEGASSGTRDSAAVEQKFDPEVTAKAVPAVDRGDADAPGRRVFMGRHNVTMTFGAAVIGGFSGLAAAYGPMISVGRRTSDHVLVSGILAGPTFGRDQQNAAGSVSIRQEMLALQVDLVGRFWKRLVARAGIGGGVYHVQIDGQVNFAGGPPLPGTVFRVGRSAGAFAGLLSWSGGIVANLRPDFGVFVDGRIFVLTPTPVILLNGIEVGRSGDPGISVTTGVELRL